jgi:hypothetical protein
LKADVVEEDAEARKQKPASGLNNTNDWLKVEIFIEAEVGRKVDLQESPEIDESGWDSKEEHIVDRGPGFISQFLIEFFIIFFLQFILLKV